MGDRADVNVSRSPIVVRQIDYDRLGGTSHDHPGKAVIGRLIDLHVGQPRRDMDEVTPARDGTELTTFAPPDKAISFEYIGDRLLLAMMMDTSAGTGLDDEDPAPKRGLNSHIYGNGGTPFRPRGLDRIPIEEGGLNDPKVAISAHGDTTMQPSRGIAIRRQSACGYDWTVTIRCSSNTRRRVAPQDLMCLLIRCFILIAGLSAELPYLLRQRSASRPCRAFKMNG
jgi:hypothetical protein